MDKSQKNLSQSCKQFNFHLDGIDSNLQMLDWINILQFASKAFIADQSLPEITRLNRARHLADLSTYLANEARDSIESYISDLEEWEKTKGKPTTKASGPSGGRHE